MLSNSLNVHMLMHIVINVATMLIVQAAGVHLGGQGVLAPLRTFACLRITCNFKKTLFDIVQTFKTLSTKVLYVLIMLIALTFK